jgi:aminoglycoside phosphotransferase (APT) family kinase protein
MSDTTADAANGAELPDAPAMTLSTRDADELRRSLESWLAGQLHEGAAPTVPEIGSNSANGMSSETVLFTATWTDPNGGEVAEELVARIAPDTANEPVFPEYALGNQFEAIRLVGEVTDVPVPPVRWLESDPAVIGSPFFVMTRVDGVVPPDVMPYTFGDNWLSDASPAEQRRLQDTSIGVLAGLHGIDGSAERFSFLASTSPGATPLRRHVAHTREWYEWARGRASRSAVVEDGFAWLDANWPEHESDSVLSWGDSRIGNMMYRDFEPVAVLDWEMAGIGPRELDLGWMVFSHLVFEQLAQTFELPGMPHFLRADDAAATYESLTGHAPQDLDWYIVYAAVQWGIVFMRTGTRQAHFGEIEMPEDVDELLHHRDLVRRLLAT